MEYVKKVLTLDIGYNIKYKIGEMENYLITISSRIPSTSDGNATIQAKTGKSKPGMDRCDFCSQVKVHVYPDFYF